MHNFNAETGAVPHFFLKFCYYSVKSKIFGLAYFHRTVIVKLHAKLIKT
jgi:hypothetical protein